MLQELAAETGASAWAIGSMLFFLAVWIGVAIWVVRRPRKEMDERARLPLEEESGVRGQDSGRSQDSGR